MDYAFSLVKLETMSVEEFLKMDGDDGWLIGKNLIVCSECRANVFLKRGEIRTPHFAHAKFRENNDGCSKRVRDYNPDRVRKLRAKQSKYRVGYFQQRFEDYLFISLLDTIKKSNLFYVNWDADSKDPSTPIIGLQKVDDSMYPEKIKHLRDIGSAITSFLLKKNKKNKGARDLGEAAQYWLDLNKSTFSKFGPEKYKKDISKNIKYEGTNFSDNGLKTDYVEEISSLKFTFRDGDEIFAAEAMTHLLQKGAEPLVGAAMAAAMELNLSTKLSQVWRDQGLGVFEEKKYGMGLDFFVDYLNDVKQSPAEHFTTVKLLRSWLDFSEIRFNKKYSNQLLGLEKKLLINGMANYIDWTGEGPKKGPYYLYYLETYASIVKLFKFINFAATAQSYYGDSANSPEEARRKAIDSKRGFVYIAWAPYLKSIWEETLERKGFNDCVKIGYSDDPDRRIDEIAGNIGPPDSIEIIDVWPMLDMKGAEDLVHHKLKRYRLSPKRELFGLDPDSAKQKVGEILEKAYGPGVSERGKTTDFS